MPYAVDLHAGGNIILGRFEDTEAKLLDGEGPLVTVLLCGSVRHPPAPSAVSETPRQATTLEIHTDPKAAILLAASISHLALTKDWPLPPGVVVLA
jgi:hypothetical protein